MILIIRDESVGTSTAKQACQPTANSLTVFLFGDLTHLSTKSEETLKSLNIVVIENVSTQLHLFNLFQTNVIIEKCIYMF